MKNIDFYKNFFLIEKDGKGYIFDAKIDTLTKELKFLLVDEVDNINSIVELQKIAEKREDLNSN